MISEELAEEIKNFEEDKQNAIKSYEHDGKYLVIAGPGTGKTFTISKRIEAILSDNEKGTSAERILCLTFSDAAAKEMRKKLEENKIPNSSSINIYTFHSFCFDLMKNNPELFDIGNKKLITNFQKQAIVKECLEQMPIKYNRNDSSLYAKIDKIVETIEAFKHYRIEKEDFDKNLADNLEWKIKEDEEIETIKELWNIYQKYKELSSNFIDFDDMIDMVLKKFDESPEFLEKTAKQFDFIMVDEYQDTNKSQNDIVFKLAKYCKNILVVGDDDQIIYTFQGASLDTIEGFLKEFKADKPKVFCLKENRRSTQTILDVSKIIAELQDRYVDFYVEKINGGALKTEKRGTDTKWFKELKNKYALADDDDDYEKIQFPLRLFSKKEEKNLKDILPKDASKELNAENDNLKNKNTPVIINRYPNAEYEKIHIVKQIKDIINDETKCPIDKKTKDKKLSEIAVLVKSNDEAEEYASLLKSEGIRVQLVRGKNIFNANSVKLLISYMQFFNDLSGYNSDKLYHFLLAKPFHISNNDYNILQDKRIKSQKNLLEQIEYAIKLSDNTEQIGKDIVILEEELKQEENKNNNKEEELKNKKEQYEKDKKYILQDKKKLQKLLNDYKILDNYRQCESVKNLIHQMACVTGILQSYISLKINRTENIDAINKFIGLAEEYSSTVPDADFYGFVEYIEALLSSNSEVFTDKTDKPLNAVQISTLHSSKGREFEYVFMPNLTKNKYESANSYKEIVPFSKKEFTPVSEFNDMGSIEDKQKQIKFLNSLKLLYVGMTRAKHSLYLSFEAGEESYFIEKLEQKAGKDLIKINEEFDEKIDNIKEDSSYETKLKEAAAKLSTFKDYIDKEHLSDFNKVCETINSLKENLVFTINPDETLRYDYDYAAEFVEYIKQNLQEKYSATSLNTYIECPKKYLCRYILNLKPYKKKGDKEKNYSMEIGNAIHFALEQMVREVNKTGQYPDIEFLYEKFDKKIQEELQKDLEEAAKLINIQEEKDKLNAYYEYLQSQIKNPKKDTFEAEKNIEMSISVEYNGKSFTIDFSGKIDRLDKNDDGTYNIIDYKTGKEKTSSSFAPDQKNEEYYNQLAIYRYILEQQDEYKGKIKEIKIVQPQLFKKENEEEKNSKNNKQNKRNPKEFRINDLEGENGLINCKNVLNKYAECIFKIKQFAEKNSNIETRKVFECKEKCNKDNFTFCDYKAFCKSMVI